MISGGLSIGDRDKDPSMLERLSLSCYFAIRRRYVCSVYISIRFMANDEVQITEAA